MVEEWSTPHRKLVNIVKTRPRAKINVLVTKRSLSTDAIAFGRRVSDLHKSGLVKLF